MPDINRHRYTPTDTRLGRHVHHDPRSRDYAITPRAITELHSVRHRSHIGVLDQGQLGSCTGNASTKAITYAPFWPKAQHVLTAKSTNPTSWADTDEQYAVGVYSDATCIDDAPGTYPPDDTGSAGIFVAKVLQARGLISGYDHAFSLEAALTAIARQPVIVGIPWYSGMFTPDGEGYIQPTGQVEGGHEICVDQLNVQERYVAFPNSWGIGWGIKGRARMTWDVFGQLLADQGDVTVFRP